MKKQSLSMKMLDLLSQEADVQQIVNEAALIFGNPVVVIDTKFHIMFFSTNIEVNIDHWKETMLREYVSDEIVSDLENSQLINRLHTGAELIEHDIPGNHKALRYPMFYRKKYIGFVGVYDYRKPLSENDGNMLRTVAKALVVALGRDRNISDDSQNDYEYLLERLIRCTDVERARWVCRKHSETVFGTRLILLCLEKRGDEEARQNIASERIRDVMKKTLYRHYSIVFENRVYMLFDLGIVSEEFWEKTLETLEKYCVSHNLTAGVSHEFDNQEFVPLAGKQAVNALKWGEDKTQERIHFFDDYMVDCMMEQCVQTYPAEFFMHPALHRLMEYDAEYHTEYYYTLRVYLDNFCSMKATAEKLNIHYNTMKYRVSMIENIIEDSLKNNNELKKKLYFSMYCQENRGGVPGEHC